MYNRAVFFCVILVCQLVASMESQSATCSQPCQIGGFAGECSGSSCPPCYASSGTGWSCYAKVNDACPWPGMTDCSAVSLPTVSNPPPPPPPPTVSNPPPPPPTVSNPPSQTSNGCALVQDTDFWGSDISNAPAGNTDDCCNYCLSVGGCTAWTLAGGVCYAKSGQGDVHTGQSGLVSGTVSNPPSNPPSSPPSSGKCKKRGLAYTFPDPADMLAVKDSITWWYNWDFQPASSEQVYSQYGVEFVPMVWGAKSLQNGLPNVPVGSKYVLGFNEPNFFAQADLSASQAAALWPQVQQTAIKASPTATANVPIASPAVNYCGGGCYDTDPFDYLDNFFASCGNCKVDFIAAHWYSCTGDALTNYLNGLKKYNKPIWITEFSCAQWDANWQDNLDFQINYMKTAVQILENDPMVFRYAWFTGRTTDIPYVNIFGSTGQLTELGTEYMNQPCGSGPYTALQDESSATYSEQNAPTNSNALVIGLSVGIIVVVVVVIVAVLIAVFKSKQTKEESV